MTYDEYVAEIVRKNMEDPMVRAAVARERRLGSAAHKTSRAAVALENYGIAKKPAVYHGGKVK